MSQGPCSPPSACGCVISSAVGWGDRHRSPRSCTKNTYRRLTDQLRELEAKARHCQPIKANHRVIKPTCMYRTQIAAIAAD